VIGEPSDGSEYRPLERQRGNHLRQRDLSMLGLGRLLFIDQAPDLLEELLPNQTGKKASQHTYRYEKEPQLRLSLSRI
jgi:hypothetical protein